MTSYESLGPDEVAGNPENHVRGAGGELSRRGTGSMKTEGIEGALQMLLRDPDGREVGVNAPLPDSK